MATDLGKIAITLEGAFDSDRVYKKLEQVTDAGSSYTSKIDNNDQPLSNVNAWQVSALKGDTGNVGATGQPGENGVYGIKDEATLTSSPTPWDSGDPDLFEIYAVKEIGTYTNFLDINNDPIEIEQQDYDTGIVRIWVKNGISSKVVETPIINIDLTSRAIAVPGKNKVNPDRGLEGYYLNTNGHDFVPNIAWKTTGKIKVDGNLIANHSIVGSGTANLVYDTNGQYIRRFDTPNYTYQSGEEFVEFSYQKVWGDFQVEEGNVSTIFENYIDKGDVFPIADNKYEPLNLSSVELNIEKINILSLPSNGAIGRQYGLDIPSTESGNNSYLQVRPFSVPMQGSYKVTVYINHINHNSFLQWENHINTSLGSGLLKVEKTFNDVNELLNIIIFPSSLVAGTLRNFRVSQVFITPLNLQSKLNLNKKINYIIEGKRIDVSKGFDSSTEGWGVNRFNNIITAWEVDSVDYLNTRKDRETYFNLMPGVYNEFETKWAGNDSENSSDYKGIIPRNNQFFKSFDLENPELTELVWDGHSGFSNGYLMNVPNQVMSRSIFHISDWQLGGVNTYIKGFKITTKNTRYCVHPESAGNGYKNKWRIENCILNWQGRPNAEVTTGGTHIGIGISPEETGIIYRCKFIGITGDYGIGGHNNPWSINMGQKPFITRGSTLTIEDSDLGNYSIKFQSISNDSDTPDKLIIKGSSNVNEVSFYTDNIALQNWKSDISCSEINNNLT